MTSFEADDILDDLFHGCAFTAFVEQASVAHGPPCPEKTRRRAYQLYEEILADKNKEHERRLANPRSG